MKKKIEKIYFICRICRLMFEKDEEIDHHILVIKHLEWEYYKND